MRKFLRELSRNVRNENMSINDSRVAVVDDVITVEIKAFSKDVQWTFGFKRLRKFAQSRNDHEN